MPLRAEVVEEIFIFSGEPYLHIGIKIPYTFGALISLIFQILQQMCNDAGLLDQEEGGSPLQNPSTTIEDVRMESMISLDSILKQVKLSVELDGGDERPGVYVIGATERIELVDEAILRSGRLGRVTYVPLPDANERTLILKALLREKPIAVDVDLDAIGRRESCRNFSGADIAEVVKEAAMLAWEDRQDAMEIDGEVPPIPVIQSSHLEQALKKVSPSVSKEVGTLEVDGVGVLTRHAQFSTYC